MTALLRPAFFILCALALCGPAATQAQPMPAIEMADIPAGSFLMGACVPASADKQRRARAARLSAPALGREELPGGPSLDDLAVLIHTGGTTGVPKAVALTHRNLASNAAQTLAWVPIVKRGAEVEAGVLPFFHAFGLTTVLVLGVSIAATIVLLPRFDVAALLAAHRRRPITLVPGVPPMFERILEAAESHAKPVDLTSICFAFSGAMALEEAVASRRGGATGG